MSLILSGTDGLSDIDGSAATPAIRGTDANTGIFFPAADTIAFAEGGVESMRIDSAGNLGLGVTPNTWYLNSSVYKAFQFGSSSLFFGNTTASSSNLTLYANAYLDTSAVSRYLYTSFASNYTQASGAHIWYTAASGTAGNAITFTQAMTLDASGNLGIGTTTPSSFDGSADNLVVGTTSGNNGITIAAGTDSASTLNFADGTAGGAQYTGYIDYQHSGNYMRFGTNGGTERMRIDSDGNVLISSGTRVGSSLLQTVVSASLKNALVQKDSGTTYGTNYYYQLYLNSADANAGSIAHTGATTVAFQTSSDVRLKENIVDAPSILEKVMATKVRSFDWKEDKKHVDYGFIAQELYEQLPEAVGMGDDAEEITDHRGTWQVEYGRLTPMLLKAIQEQQALITTLTERITALEAK